MAKPYPQDVKDEACRMYEFGFSGREITELLGASDYAVYRWVNPENYKRHLKAKNNQRRDNPEWAWAERCCYRAKAVSLEENLPFDLDVEFVHLLLLDTGKVCPVFRRPFVFSPGKKGTPKMAASLDRRIPELGYVRSNVQVISYLANKMKQDVSLDDLRTFAQWCLAV